MGDGQVSSPKIRKSYKDSFFRFLFGDESRKSWTLSLYNALNQSNYTDPNLLTFNTINDVIYMNVKNDISFLICSEMNLYEHQSSVNPNMPLRGLIYFGRLFDRYVDEQELNLYSRSQLHLPTPRYVVFYNGKEENFEQKTLHLRNAFLNAEKSCIDLEALVLNINMGHNRQLMKQCRTLGEYAAFVAKAREYKDQGVEFKIAVDRAVDYCIHHQILSNLLRAHKAEVIGMCLTEYDEEKTLKATYQEGKEEGREEGSRDLARLIKILLEEGKNEEISKVVSDAAERQRMLKLYEDRIEESYD